MRALRFATYSYALLLVQAVHAASRRQYPHQYRGGLCLWPHTHQPVLPGYTPGFCMEAGQPGGCSSACCAKSCDPPHHTHGPQQLLRSMVAAWLVEEDHRMFEEVTGGSVAAMLEDTSPSDEDARDALGMSKFVPHPLNPRGMHVLRAQLAARITEGLRRRRGLQHPLLEKILDDGIVVVPHFSKHPLLSRGLFRKNGRFHFTRNSSIAQLLHALSGYDALDTVSFTSVEQFRHKAHDHQSYLHVDTWLPTWKLFIFKSVGVAEGAYHFVVGSHRNTIGKLRWLYDRTRHLTNWTDAFAQTPQLHAAGPYADETHGHCASLRFLGFDPEAALEASKADLAKYGFPVPTPCIAGPDDGLTLVITDTSGLHYRGFAPPGTVRTQAGLQSKRGDGCDYCLSRKNPFYCAQASDPC